MVKELLLRCILWLFQRFELWTLSISTTLIVLFESCVDFVLRSLPYIFCPAIAPEFFSQSDCRMHMHLRTSENIVLQALMDEHQENRDLQNLTSEILNREKVRLLEIQCIDKFMKFIWFLGRVLWSFKIYKSKDQH